MPAANLRSLALRILKCLGKFLRIEDIRTSLNDLEKCEMLTRQELIPGRRGTPGWSGPKDQQNKTDKFLSVFGSCMSL